MAAATVALALTAAVGSCVLLGGDAGVGSRVAASATGRRFERHPSNAVKPHFWPGVIVAPEDVIATVGAQRAIGETDCNASGYAKRAGHRRERARELLTETLLDAQERFDRIVAAPELHVDVVLELSSEPVLQCDHLVERGGRALSHRCRCIARHFREVARQLEVNAAGWVKDGGRAQHLRRWSRDHRTNCDAIAGLQRRLSQHKAVGIDRPEDARIRD